MLTTVLQLSMAPAMADIERYANLNTLNSNALPAINLTLDESFEFVGRFDFEIRDVAAGQRWVFVEFDHQFAERLFIVQFEQVLSESDVTYNYDFSEAMEIGSFRFRQNPYAFSIKAAAAANPQGEAALTAKFLYDHAVEVQDEWMMSRYVMVPDDARKHEMILFYVEMIEPSGYSLRDFYDGHRETEAWKRISAALRQRAEAAFSVEPREIARPEESIADDSGLEPGQYQVTYGRRGISVDGGEPIAPRDLPAHLRRGLNASQIIVRKATMEQMGCLALIARKAKVDLLIEKKDGSMEEVNIPPGALRWDFCRTER